MNIFKHLFLPIFFGFLIFAVSVVFAASLDDVNYPVAELGNCESQEACSTYCDLTENHLTCINFARSSELIVQSEAERMAELEKFEQGMESAFKDTPGGCVAPRECDAYCRIEEHLDECLNYSIKIGHTTQEEATKIQEKARKGGPGGCKSKEECRTYCDSPEHSDECMQFLVNEGKLTQEQAKFAVEAMREANELRDQGPKEINQEKAAEILKTTAGPGGCATVEECSKYCGGGEHMEECVGFAQQNGLMAPEEVEKVKKFMKAGGPGGCKGQKECRAYCDSEEHRDECMNFSLQSGMMTQEQYEKMKRLREMMEKTDQPSAARPGGCQTDGECNQYCSDSSHIEECIDYARSGGRLSGDVVKNMMGKSEDARKKFEEMEQERKKFFESKGGQMPPGEGYGPSEGGNYGPPEGFQPPEGWRPPTNGNYGPPGNGYGPPEGFQPPSGGSYGPPEGGNYGPPEGFQPMEGWQPPTNGNYGPPSDAQMPPEGQQLPAPSSLLRNFLGSAISTFKDLLSWR